MPHAVSLLPQPGHVANGGWRRRGRVGRYRAYWGEDGGITVSGGEALLQIDGLIDLFEEAHSRGINTCLDTAAQPFSRTERSSESS